MGKNVDVAAEWTHKRGEDRHHCSRACMAVLSVPRSILAYPPSALGTDGATDRAHLDV